MLSWDVQEETFTFQSILLPFENAADGKWMVSVVVILYSLFLYTNVHLVQGPRDTQGRELLCGVVFSMRKDKKCSSLGFVS